VASTSIGCLFCCKGCNAEKVRNAFTYIPPPPSYTVEADPEDRTKGKIKYLMDGLRGSPLYRQAAEASEVRWVTNRKGFRVPLVWLRRQIPKVAEGDASEGSSAALQSAEQPPLVLLHCHGNATDIGLMMVPYYELATVLGIEVVGVEYSGYGAASGKPSSSSTQADLEAAYDFVASLGIPPKRIVAYGQSVGSGPVSFLAGKRQLGGIVLHSPLLSGIKVLDPQPDSCCRPSCVWHCFDFYPNDRSVQKLTCPAFIMHGQRDDIIPFYHGERLYKACPKASRWPPYFPARAGHNDLVETDMRMYFGEVSSFLNELKRVADGNKAKAEPPSSDTPLQVAMSQPRQVGHSTTVEVNANSREELAAPAIGKPACDVGDFIGATPEPRAGPEDGRYEQLRRGNLAVPGGLCSPEDSPGQSEQPIHAPALSCTS